jgi:hypothetical protein
VVGADRRRDCAACSTFSAGIALGLLDRGGSASFTDDVLASGRRR